MTSAVGPAARMQIARGLIELRDRAELTQIQVAEVAGCSKATVSRYEDWTDRRRVKWATVKALAEACGGNAAEVAALVEMAKSQAAAGWWVGNPAVPEWLSPLVSFESLAGYELVTAPTLVPGLLQTRDYARALLSGQGLTGDRLDQETEARMQRQTVLDRGMRLWVILDETALRRQVGSASVMADQLGHLHEAGKRPTVDIQVLPFTAGPPCAPGQFLILGREDERDPRSSMAVVYLELPQRGVYLDDPDDVAAYKIMFNRLRAQASGTADTADLLTTVRQEYLR
ncbi:helix-turn-helix transcriptional regulator [Streptomyces sodiiphilus]|uniref:Helix-turn-helix transcriptional regulator n=1 Tax=Streptomyces sodiiphilus TaxID=226217 RepID=A0ABN2PMI2_9ACTN